MRSLAVWLLMAPALAAALLPRPAAGQTEGEVLVLARANLIDGISAEPLRNATVLVRGGRIDRVSTGEGPVPRGARVIDLNGRWLLPGLIDAHVHLRDLASARSALAAGVTTARSLGAVHFVDVGIRELHRGGASDLPDMIAAGYHVRRRVAEEFFVDTPRLRHLMPGVSGAEQVRQVTRALVQRGADVVKVMATERAGVPDTDLLRRVLTDEELGAAVAEAARAGVPVAAHAHTDQAARSAVRAGVRTIEHGTLLTDTTLALMRDRGACLVPTLSFWMDMLEPGGEYDHPVLAARARTMAPRAREAAALAWKMGVRVAAGSDMRYDAVSPYNVVDEVAHLAQSGVPAMDAIRAATSTAAACLGLDRRTGTVQAGREADLIVVQDDPLADIGRLKAVVMVINDGRIAVDRLAR